MSKEVNLIEATDENCIELACLNKQLNDDGGCNNNMSVVELEKRMHTFLLSGYKAIIFEANGVHIGYTLIEINRTPVFIRHFFIIGEYRRQGYGKAAFKKIINYLKADELDLSVLISNSIGYKFWKECGLKPYEVLMRYKSNNRMGDDNC